MRLAARYGASPSASGEPPLARPGDVVRWMFAMQARGFPGAKCSVGAHLPETTDAAVEAALHSRELVRSWPMRGTLHLIAGEDLGWILAFTAPRLIRGMTTRRARLGIAERDLDAVGDLARDALSGGRTLERGELLAVFEAAGRPTSRDRGYHLLMYLPLTAVIVFGPIAGRQHSFALLDE